MDEPWTQRASPRPTSRSPRSNRRSCSLLTSPVGLRAPFQRSRGKALQPLQIAERVTHAGTPAGSGRQWSAGPTRRLAETCRATMIIAGRTTGQPGVPELLPRQTADGVRAGRAAAGDADVGAVDVAGLLSQAVRRWGVRRSRYVGLAQTQVESPEDTFGEFRRHPGAALVTGAALLDASRHARGRRLPATARTEFANSISRGLYPVLRWFTASAGYRTRLLRVRPTRFWRSRLDYSASGNICTCR
jgi:hypothetical protein